MNLVAVAVVAVGLPLHVAAACVSPPSGKRSVVIELKSHIVRNALGECIHSRRNESAGVIEEKPGLFRNGRRSLDCTCHPQDVSPDDGPMCLETREGGEEASEDGIAPGLLLRDLRKAPITLSQPYAGGALTTTYRLAREWSEVFDGCSYRIAEIELDGVSRLYHLVDLRLTVYYPRPMPFFGNVESLKN